MKQERETLRSSADATLGSTQLLRTFPFNKKTRQSKAPTLRRKQIEGRDRDVKLQVTPQNGAATNGVHFPVWA